MSQPLRRIDTFDSAGTGDPFLTKAHTQIGFVVRVEGAADPANITFEATIEGSVDGEDWSPLGTAEPRVNDVFSVTSDDVTQLGSNPTVLHATVSDHHYMVEMLRVRVVEASAEVDSIETTVFLNGKSGRGVQYGRDASIDN